MAALATTEDFEARHGTLDDADGPIVGALLDDATSLIRNAVPALTDEWAADAENAEQANTVRAVCVQVAYRAWSNPDAIAREELGEAARTLRGDDQSDAMWLTRAERATLRRAAGLGGRALGSIQVETTFAGPASTNDLLDDEEGQ